ncbi:MAG TPA: hypothetical protein VF373_04680 [Prolixibacteraceae bacterium]
MLILSKTSIKTSVIILLFTIGTTYLFAGNQAGNVISDQTFINLEDTIKTGITEKKEINQEAAFTIPDKLVSENVKFRVNSDISYFRFSHFVKNESKKMFIQAWLKEKEAKALSAKTDSLRKTYANSSSEQKELISAQILKAEARSISLNEEIPILYEKAREIENQYWQSATTDKIAKFQEKVKAFKDSINLAVKLQGQQTIITNPEIPDTIIFYGSKPTAAEIKTEESGGIIYKIQIGAYKSKIPDSSAKLIKRLSIIRKVENYKDEKGVTIYTTGSLKNYPEAVTLQNQVKQEGIKNAAIVAFQNGKKITVIEARKLNN